MLILTGAAALSDFRLAKRLASIRALVPDASAIDARFVHFVDIERELNHDESAVLESLLRYGPRNRGGELDGHEINVVGRDGTV